MEEYRKVVTRLVLKCASEMRFVSLRSSRCKREFVATYSLIYWLVQLMLSPVSLYHSSLKSFHFTVKVEEMIGKC